MSRWKTFVPGPGGEKVETTSDRAADALRESEMEPKCDGCKNPFPGNPSADEPRGKQKEESEEWLREYAARMNSYDDPEKAYSRLMEGLKTGNLHSYGSDLSRDDLRDADELRYHAQIILDKTINWDDYSFSCSC